MVGVLGDDTDPMVSVMKLEKAPQETYADIGGLDTQIQEIKVLNIFCVNLHAAFIKTNFSTCINKPFHMPPHLIIHCTTVFTSL